MLILQLDLILFHFHFLQQSLLCHFRCQRKPFELFSHLVDFGKSVPLFLGDKRIIERFLNVVVCLLEQSIVNFCFFLPLFEYFVKSLISSFDYLLRIVKILIFFYFLLDFGLHLVQKRIVNVLLRS